MSSDSTGNNRRSNQNKVVKNNLTSDDIIRQYFDQWKDIALLDLANQSIPMTYSFAPNQNFIINFKDTGFHFSVSVNKIKVNKVDHVEFSGEGFLNTKKYEIDVKMNLAQIRGFLKKPKSTLITSPGSLDTASNYEENIYSVKSEPTDDTQQTASNVQEINQSTINTLPSISYEIDVFQPSGSKTKFPNLDYRSEISTLTKTSDINKEINKMNMEVETTSKITAKNTPIYTCTYEIKSEKKDQHDFQQTSDTTTTSENTQNTDTSASHRYFKKIMLDNYKSKLSKDDKKTKPD